MVARDVSERGWNDLIDLMDSLITRAGVEMAERAGTRLCDVANRTLRCND